MWISLTVFLSAACTHQYNSKAELQLSGDVAIFIYIYPHFPTYTTTFSVTPLLSCDQADSREEWTECEHRTVDQSELPLSHTLKDKTALAEQKPK